MDLEFYSFTTTCTQISLTKLFKNGFNTGHGHLRSPNSIRSYGALAAIAIQSNQNDQHGGQSIPSFDRDMAPGVAKTYNKKFRKHLREIYEDYTDQENVKEFIESTVDLTEVKMNESVKLDNSEEWDSVLSEELNRINSDSTVYPNLQVLNKIVKIARKRAYEDTDRETYQAMEGFIHNLNTMHSRAGAQVPFSSINYGTDTSPEGRMVMKNLLLTTIAGLGNGETPIFP